MARSKKKSTLSQKVVGVAATGLPSPVRKAASSRFGSRLILLCIPVLIATGLLTIQWENGRPRFAWDRQRAAEVKHEAAERIEDLRDERRHEKLGERVGEWKDRLAPRR